MVRVFFSYSHDDEEHKAWVSSSADDLEQRGFDVVLDQRHLRPGQDIHQFAERAVVSADFVLLVCTPAYARRANERKRGVGMETSLITSAIYKGTEGKFIALLRRGEPDDSIPYYMQNTLFVDVRNGDTAAWATLCDHMAERGDVTQIGTLIFEALFPYDPARIYDQPRLHELKRFTEFVETGQSQSGRWFVIRRDPIKDDHATIFFQDPA